MPTGHRSNGPVAFHISLQVKEKALQVSTSPEFNLNLKPYRHEKKSGDGHEKREKKEKRKKHKRHAHRD